MPVIKSAKKKLRKDRKRRVQNLSVKNTLKALIKAARDSKSDKDMKKAFQAVDKAAKVHVLHKNKAARIKSRLSKLLPKKETTAKKAEASPKKPAVKKSSKKSAK